MGRKGRAGREGKEEVGVARRRGRNEMGRREREGGREGKLGRVFFSFFFSFFGGRVGDVYVRELGSRLAALLHI